MGTTQFVQLFDQTTIEKNVTHILQHKMYSHHILHVYYFINFLGCMMQQRHLQCTKTITLCLKKKEGNANSPFKFGVIAF